MELKVATKRRGIETSGKTTMPTRAQDAAMAAPPTKAISSVGYNGEKILFASETSHLAEEVQVAFLTGSLKSAMANELSYNVDVPLVDFLQPLNLTKLSLGACSCPCFVSVQTIVRILAVAPRLTQLVVQGGLTLAGSAHQFIILSKTLPQLTQMKNLQLGQLYVIRHSTGREVEVPGMLDDAVVVLSNTLSSLNITCDPDLISAKAFEQVGQSSRLEELVLLRDALEDAQVVALMRGLETNKTLQTLRIYCRGLTKSEAALSIFKVLRNNRNSLQEFQLECEAWTEEETMLALLDDLAVSEIRSFSFEGPFICGDSKPLQKAALELLQANLFLEHFDLFCPGCCTIRFLDTLRFYTKLNKLGRRHLVQSHDAQTWVDSLGQQDVKSIFYFLSQNPTILFPLALPEVTRRVTGKRKRLYRATKYTKKSYRY